MSEKKYFIDLTTDLPHTRLNQVHQRWPSDPETVRRLKRLGSDEPQSKPKYSLGFQIFWLTVLIAVAFAAFLYFGS